MSQNSLRNAEEATKNTELLGSTNQHDAKNQVRDIKEQLENNDRDAVAAREEKNAKEVKARSVRKSKKGNK